MTDIKKNVVVISRIPFQVGNSANSAALHEGPSRSGSERKWLLLAQWQVAATLTQQRQQLVNSGRPKQVAVHPRVRPWQVLKAQLHGTIRPHGACRLPCTCANRKVWHVTRMYWTGENRVKRNYTSFYFCRTSCAITQSECCKHLKRPSPNTTPKARRVAAYQCT